MRVSQKLDYTLRGLVALAGAPPGELVGASELAKRLGMPRRFLEQQFTAMHKCGLLVAQRGYGGGAVLARPASEITVGDVVRAVQRYILDIPRVSYSSSSEMWAVASKALSSELDSTTLADLAVRQAEMDRQRRSEGPQHRSDSLSTVSRSRE
jgi:Rrf2 family protein